MSEMNRRGFLKLPLAVIGLWILPKVAEDISAEGNPMMMLSMGPYDAAKYEVRTEDWQYDGPLYIRQIFWWDPGIKWQEWHELEERV